VKVALRISIFIFVLAALVTFQNCAKGPGSEGGASKGEEPWHGNFEQVFVDLNSTCPDGSYSHAITHDGVTNEFKYITKDCQAVEIVVQIDQWIETNVKFSHDGRVFEIRMDQGR
jgi:hypothetical protein